MMWRTNCTHDATVPRMSPHRILVQFAVVAMVVGVVAACGDADVATSSSTTAKADSSTSTAAKDANGDGSQGADEPTWDTDAQPKRGGTARRSPSSVHRMGNRPPGGDLHRRLVDLRRRGAVGADHVRLGRVGEVHDRLLVRVPTRRVRRTASNRRATEPGAGASRCPRPPMMQSPSPPAPSRGRGPQRHSAARSATASPCGVRPAGRRRRCGSGPYTADSSICTAGVHAGLITIADGGTVVIEVAAGQESYEASDANGVSTSSYGSYGSSFTFPQDQTPG